MPKEGNSSTPIQIIYPKYAQGFWIEIFEDHKIIHLRNTYDSTQIIDNYILTKDKNKFSGNDITIQTPIQKNACLSTTQIGFIELLGLVDSIVAVSESKRIFNESVQQNIASGKIASVGDYESINEEKLLTLNPSVVFAYSFNEGGNSLFKMRSLGLNIVLINDYNEIHPLARAEWIKMIATFYDKEALADSIFSAIEQDYLQYKIYAQNTTGKPDVFCNLPWKEVWYMPSGNSYFSKFIEDAGGNFLWKENTTTRSLNLDFESVFAQAADADIWLNPNSAKSLQEMLLQDKKFQNFKAFKTGNIYNFTQLENSLGNNAFWESGVAQPNIILKDLISIFHPELLPNYQSVYYQKLKNDQ